MKKPLRQCSSSPINTWHSGRMGLVTPPCSDLWELVLETIKLSKICFLLNVSLAGIGGSGLSRSALLIFHCICICIGSQEFMKINEPGE